MNININFTFTPEHLWSMICGSGWETWSWWYALDYVGGDWDKPCDLWVVVDNPFTDDDASGSEDALCAKVSIADIAQAISELQNHPQVMECLASDDFDAVYGDVVMQQAVFGEVIYG